MSCGSSQDTLGRLMLFSGDEGTMSPAPVSHNRQGGQPDTESLAREVLVINGLPLEARATAMGVWMSKVQRYGGDVYNQVVQRAVGMLSTMVRVPALPRPSSRVPCTHTAQKWELSALYLLLLSCKVSVVVWLCNVLTINSCCSAPTHCQGQTKQDLAVWINPRLRTPSAVAVSGPDLMTSTQHPRPGELRLVQFPSAAAHTPEDCQVILNQRCVSCQSVYVMVQSP